ncbi:Midasin [Wickerhamomyces ciferrii]|uniref:Midasin n=1 Tax=Wickerhamomyces ciferrii (strain ATCC 14091 / BCRC 22168 / CBS 111 / JCM 3599 / NBRC 0793 / NRRL Y-1031 F-60-10) TaxID=1206466 RepID=K0KGQ8_WICCF|nr:Midasin [Wickerhamomyces ciferrii]CCH41367.1 Midasin [Wickerhamomyces ciferrii]
MPSTNNLAQYFAQSQQQGQQGSSSNKPTSIPRSSKSHSSSSYNIHSKAVDAEDDDHFESSTFALKRTRSVGLLDEFIAPTRKLIEEGEGNQSESDNEDDDYDQKYDIDYDENNLSKNTKINTNTTTTNNNNDDDDDENQFIEDIDDETYKSKQNQSNKKNSNVYSYDDDYNTYSSYENDENASISPSPPDTPDLYQPHDDNDIVYEPQRHVDYLSHNWKEGDISKSWRYIVLKRKDVANSARLENASWRTWAQAKYHLKTISPEAVNWLKDSDVTWLYGPLYKDPPKTQTLGSTTSTTSSSSNLGNDGDKKYGSDSESTSKNKTPLKPKKIKGPKPILKKRTVSEMLSQPSMIKLPPRHHSPLVDFSHPNLPSPPHIDDDFDLISSRVNAQYKSNQSSNDQIQNQNIPTNQNSINMSKQGSQQSGFNDNSSIQSKSQQQQQQPQKRHIHFNDRVDQCIAVNIPDSEDEDYEGDEEEFMDNEDSDSDEEGGFFLQVRAPSTPQVHNKDFQLPLSSNEAKNLTHGEQPSEYQTIKLLPCTTLNYGSDEEDESEDVNKFAVSHNTNTSRGFNYYYDYNSVYSNDVSHVSLGHNDYAIDDDDVHHLEGVKMVDVPENIVLGSNVEIEDTPHFAEPQHIKDHDSTKIENNDQIKQPQPTRVTNANGEVNNSDSYNSKNDQKIGGSAFDLHSDDESSEDVDIEEEEDQPINTSISSSGKNFGENLTKVSSSPSYASLSDVAAQGYISQSANTNSNLSNIVSKNYSPNSSNSSPVSSNNSDQRDVNELQKDFGNLSPSEERSGFNYRFLKNWKKG